MLKKLLLASALTLAFSGTAMASDAPQPSAPGCTSCALPTSNTAAPVQMGLLQMQAQQAQQVPGRANAVRGDWEQGALKTCCDPALANISWGNALSWDETTGVIGSRYGVTFNTAAVPGLDAAMHNTAMVAHVMNGSIGPSSFLVMTGDLKTDDMNGASWPSDPGPFDQNAPLRAVNAWNSPAGGYTNFNPIGTPQAAMGWWHHSSTSWHGNIQSFGATAAGGWTPSTHMRGDNTRYTLKSSFWLWYVVSPPGAPTVWRKRRVFCNNLGDKYFGWQRGGSAFKLAGKQGISVADGPQVPSNAKIQLGNPEPLNAAELQHVQKMQSQQR